MEDKSKIIQEAIAYKEKLEKEVIRLRKENAELKADNERLKAECDMYKTFYRAKHDDIKGILFKYRQTLQEIKKIAKASSPYIDNLEIKSATEVGYDYAAICNELEKRLHKVLELIYKAESEG